MIAYCVLSFFLYSIIGWLYESTLCSFITEKRFINRGFLIGPYCPIYGAGAVASYLALNRIDNPFLLFFAGMVLCCTIEYITSFLMEKFFHARWWDYSDFHFNIKGRVCLYGGLIFGAFILILIRWIYPFVYGWMSRIPNRMAQAISFVLFILFIIDIIVTSCSMVDFNAQLERIADIVQLGKEKVHFDNTIFSQKAKEILSVLQGRGNILKANQRRIMEAFPKLNSIDYNGMIERVKQLLHTKD